MAQNITLKTLTPLHIGSGKEYAGNFEFLYFAKEEKIVIVDEQKVLKIIGNENIDEWVKMIDKKGDLLTFLKSYKTNLAINDVKHKSISATDFPKQTQSIKQFMQDGMGKNYIAGSSLKGAIRTALLTFLIKENANFTTQKKNLGFENRNGFKFKDAEVVKHYLGSDPNHDILRLLQVGDFYPTNENIETECLKSGIMNLFNQGWSYKKEQYGFVECLSENTQAQGQIHINENLKKAIESKVKRGEERGFLIEHFQHLTMEKLFELINNHTLDLIQYELGFWQDEDINEDIEAYINILESIESSIENIANPKKECIMRVGAGSGWDFMTGGWAKEVGDENWKVLKRSLRYKPYNDGIPFPKTRKLSQNQPLGFVKLSY